MQTTERPEYTYEYHWGRIAAVMVALTALVIGGLFLFGGNESANENKATFATAETTPQPADIGQTEIAQTEIEPVASVDIESTPPESAEQVVTASLEERAAQTVSEETAVAEAESTTIVNDITSTKSEEQPQTSSDDIAAIEPDTTNKLDVVTNTQVVVDRTSPKTSDTRTKAQLFTETIKRAKLTTQVNRREPGESLPKQLSLAENGLSKVFFYTEVIGQAGKTHYHKWYHEGKLKAKVPITIGSDRWRCYSSKYLTNQQTGEWTVKVENAQGKLLAQSEFHFVDQ